MTKDELIARIRRARTERQTWETMLLADEWASRNPEHSYEIGGEMEGLAILRSRMGWPYVKSPRRDTYKATQT